MKQFTLKKIYMIAISVLLLIAITVSVAYFCFGWFAENKAVTANGMLTSVNADNGIKFTETVTATHYTLTDKTITYTYKNDGNGNLTLTTKETINSDKTEKTVVDLTADTPTITPSTSTDNGTTWSDGTAYEYTYDKETGTYTYTVTNDDDTEETVTVYEEYLINNILPGEYIDVTIGFYITDDDLVGDGYTVSLGDFASDTKNTFELTIDSKTVSCGVLPAFKWGTPSEDTKGNDTTNYTFFHGEYDSSYNKSGGFFYYVNGGNDSTYTETIKSDGTWTGDNLSAKGDGTDSTPVSFTFRIMEDFTEYYKLFNNTTAIYGNYLSSKIMNIGQIRVAAKEGSST